MTRLLWLPLLTTLLSAAEPPGRVFLISLDGLGHKAFLEDPAASDLRTMRRLAEDGVLTPMQAAFPSLTAPGHASIFTGTYGNVSGVTANDIPLTFDKFATGFRAEQLHTDTVWVRAARSGIRAVAHNPTQGYPCTSHNSGPGIALMNGYQTSTLAPHTILRAADVKWLPAAPAGFAAPRASRRHLRFFEYTSGRLQFAGVIFAKGPRYDTIRLTARGGHRYVDAPLKDAESDPVRIDSNSPRPLARYFSEALPVANVTAVHFRLFELSADASDFLLYQTEAKEISVCLDGPTQAESFKRRLLSTAGAFIGNGAGGIYRAGKLGPVHTNGLAERRWLETLELHARQTMRHTRALLAEFNPRLLIDYLSTADDMLHDWWGFVENGNRTNEPFRRWGYQIIDWRVDQLRQLLNEQDHLIVVSDHGMTAVEHDFRPNVLLAELGLRDRVRSAAYFLRLKDRSDSATLALAKEKLSALTLNGKPVIAAWYSPAAFGAKFGIGGEFGGDLYFDLAPGIYLSPSDKPPLLAPSRRRGEHGPLPTRPELYALFLAIGPELHSRSVSMRSIDVAPLVLKLLGVQ
jgi:hypothetical protein